MELVERTWNRPGTLPRKWPRGNWCHSTTTLSRYTSCIEAWNSRLGSGSERVFSWVVGISSCYCCLGRRYFIQSELSRLGSQSLADPLLLLLTESILLFFQAMPSVQRAERGFGESFSHFTRGVLHWLRCRDWKDHNLHRQSIVVLVVWQMLDQGFRRFMAPCTLYLSSEAQKNVQEA